MKIHIQQTILSLLFLTIGFIGSGWVQADPSSGADGSVPVSSSSVTIGGETFSVDPRSGTLDYGFTFFQGNVNYGQTPFTFALKYQQSAAGNYTGDVAAGPEITSPTSPVNYGASAYWPTRLPEGNYFLQPSPDDSGAIWELNLPTIYISTTLASKYYGSNLIAATVSLGDVTYQYLMPMQAASTSDNAVPWDSYSTAFVNYATPLYSKDAELMSQSTYPYNVGGNQWGIRIQDQYGVAYYFQPGVAYGWYGADVYRPRKGMFDNNLGIQPNAETVLIYRIQRIQYPTGKSLNFSYNFPVVPATGTHGWSGPWTNPAGAWVKVQDTAGNTIAQVSFTASSATASVSNQQGQLSDLYQINYDTSGYRVQNIVNLSNQRTISIAYETAKGVPYQWMNQTLLTSISNRYTGLNTALGYVQFNTHDAYDAGCNQFYLGQMAVQAVGNADANNNPISRTFYDYRFDIAASSNFILPQVSGSKTYASGLSHWLDNLFYANNQDSNHCGSSQIAAQSLTYSVFVASNFADSNRNLQQIFGYDALGRMFSSQISKQYPGGNVFYPTYSQQNYSYGYSVTNATGTFADLPIWYALPQTTNDQVNVCSLNGAFLSNTTSCFLTKSTQKQYDTAGNTTQEISPIGQKTTTTWLPANQTSPSNERLPLTVTTYSPGQNGAAWRQTNTTYSNIAVAPSGIGALATMTLPTAKTETHLDLGGTTPYAYRTESKTFSSGNANALLDGLLTQYQLADGTGISDVKSLTTSYATNLANNVLNINTTLAGTSASGGSSINPSVAQVNFMGYPLQATNPLGQSYTLAYDNYGRLTALSKMVGTAYQQTSTKAYDLDLALDSNAKFSLRETDEYGNQSVKLYDFRHRHYATYRQLNGKSRVLVESYVYNPTTDVLATASFYGNGYTKTENYYYYPGTGLWLATVPTTGLARGRIIDGINGNTLEFHYQPASGSPTLIQKIYGPVEITHIDNLSNRVLTRGKIDANVATTALQGFDLIATPPTASLQSAPSSHLWFSSLASIPSPLANLYTVIGKHGADKLTPSGGLLEVDVMGYDEWYRHVSTQHYTFVNNGQLSTTATSLAYNTAQRQRTITYPQGQQKTETYNLLNGLQAASLTVVGYGTTPLGSFAHDGLGRVLRYDDSLNGGFSTGTYDPQTGLLLTQTDVYGNILTNTYDPVSYQRTHSAIAPAGGGEPVAVDYTYDSHLHLTGLVDQLNNNYKWGYASTGLMGNQSIQLLSYSSNLLMVPFQSNYTYDDYGELTQATDPFLPYSLGTGSSCQMVTNPTSANNAGTGYSVTRDSIGRISSISTTYHGVNRAFAYDAVTGLLTTDTLNLPATLADCGSANTTLSTAFVYDNNLRITGKSVQRGDLPSYASGAPTGVADVVLKVKAANTAQKNGTLRYEFTVLNRSTQLSGGISPNVTLSLLPSGPGAVGLQYTKVPGICQPSGGGLNCQIPQLTQKTLVVEVRPGALGELIHTARAFARVIDPDPRNHLLKASTNICLTLQACSAGSGVKYLADVSPPGAVNIANFAQSYDAAGHVVFSSRQDFAGTALEENFSYDPVTWALLNYSNNNGSAAPSFDQSSGPAVINASSYYYDTYGYGNLIAINASLNDGSNSYRALTYDIANPFRPVNVQETNVTSTTVNQILSGNYTYDIAGNVSTDGYGRQFSYDAHGLLNSITRADSSKETLTRDGLGRVIQRQAPWLNGTVYDYGRAKLQLDSQGNFNWQTGYLGGKAVYTGLWTGFDTVDAIESPPDFIGISDIQGRTVNGLGYGSNSNGFNVQANTAYLPFGAATNLMNPAAGFPAGLNNAANYPDAALGTANGIDVGTGLEMKGGYRAYDPVIGHFLQMDSMSPFGRGGLNGYAYANNDPINFRDPTGHYATLVHMRYGPEGKVHYSDPGYWQGLGDGLKAGFVEIGYGFIDLGIEINNIINGTHNAIAGASSNDPNQNNPGGIGENMAPVYYLVRDLALTGLSYLEGKHFLFSEFLSINAASVFEGHSPFTPHDPNAYQIGYAMGAQTADGVTAAAMAVDPEVLQVVFGKIGAGGTAAVNADVNVMEDAVKSSSDGTSAEENQLPAPHTTEANERAASAQDSMATSFHSLPEFYTPAGSFASDSSQITIFDANDFDDAASTENQIDQIARKDRNEKPSRRNSLLPKKEAEAPVGSLVHEDAPDPKASNFRVLHEGLEMLNKIHEIGSLSNEVLEQDRENKSADENGNNDKW